MSFRKSDLTPMELEVVENLEGGDEFEGFPYSCVEDIAEGIGRTTNVTRGIITSLVKKEIVSVEDCVSGCPPFVLLIATPEEENELLVTLIRCRQWMIARGVNVESEFFENIDNVIARAQTPIERMDDQLNTLLGPKPE